MEQSEQDVARIEEELETLTQELRTEVDRIAAASEERARAIEEVVLRPRRSDIAVLEVELAWVV